MDFIGIDNQADGEISLAQHKKATASLLKKKKTMLLNTFDSTWVQGTGCQKFVKEDADDKDVKVQIVDVARRDPNDLKSTSGTVVFLGSLIIC